MMVATERDALAAAVDRMVEAARELRMPGRRDGLAPTLDDQLPLLEELAIAFAAMAEPLALPIIVTEERRAWQLGRIQQEAGALAAIMAALGNDRLVASDVAGLAVVVIGRRINPGTGPAVDLAASARVVELRPLEAARRRWRDALAEARSLGLHATWREPPWTASARQHRATADFYIEALRNWLSQPVPVIALMPFLAREPLFDVIESELSPPPAAVPLYASLLLMLLAIPFPPAPDPGKDAFQRVLLFYGMH